MQGKKLHEILTSDVIGVLPETFFSEAMEIMGEKNISCILVLEEKRPIGILTERSIVSYAALHKRNINACQSQELMSSPVFTAHQDLELDEAYELLMNKKIRHLVVVDDHDRAVGVVTLSNIIEHLGYDYFVEMKKTSQTMTKIPFTLTGEVSAHEAMNEMAARSISCLIITEGKQPVGILTERDMIRLLNKRCDLREIKVEEVMSRPVHTIYGDAPVLAASRMMKQKKIRRLVVIDDCNELLGLITQYDIVKGVEVRYIENLKHDTRKKNLEIVEALRELGEKNVYLDNLLSSSINLGIAATDLSGNITHYNPAAEKIFSIPAKSVIGRDIRELHQHLDIDLTRFDKILEKVQENKIHTFSFARADKNGTRYISARVSGIRNQVHRLVGLILTCQDVTERRLAEEEIKRNNQSLNLINRLLNLSLANYSLPEIMDSFLRDLTSLYWLDLKSAGAAFLLDAATETLRMVAHSGIPDTVRRQCSSLPLGRCLCGRAALSGELIFVSEMNELHENLCRDIGPYGHYCVPFLSASREVLGVFSIHLQAGSCPDPKIEETLLAVAGVMAGIIERTLAKEALKQSLAIQQTIIDGGTESIMVIGQDYRVKMINKVARQLHLKTPEQDVHSLFCHQITHRNDKPCSGKDHRCPMQEVIKTGKPSTVTHSHIRKDGYRYQVEIIASPVFDEHGLVTGIVEVGRDITKRLLLEEERKRTEERLFHRQKAESIATLAGGVAHDFNNILTIVLGNAELLKKTTSSDKEQCQFIDAITFATQRMAQLIRQLLAYANSGKGQKSYFPDNNSQREIVSLNQLVNEAVELACKEGKAFLDIRIEQYPDQDLWPVSVDAGQTRQMLVNILLNALEAMEKSDGRLTLRAANVVKRQKWTCAHHDDHPGGEYVRVSIADTGPGIPKSIRGRIFEPFFSTKFVGRGLGLATALGIARNHGGCISVESYHKRGSIFHVLLPRAKA